MLWNVVGRDIWKCCDREIRMGHELGAGLGSLCQDENLCDLMQGQFEVC